ncbi:MULTISPECIES: TetR family transcriptional regulator [Aeromonas]|jgi:TetR/AcrR family acrAB operon transcriptional repressor|uniref:TetR family transcriptional regulator n=1 Tax=Aeromonas media TaxID=651 RepID=A0AAP6G8W4_AERME|nr:MULTISPECIES: TetR family transcriptional regulator [Aeromonas]MCK2083339.1 TetR family transcriptional regulator [Aeromonas genomosp. paramedia]MDX7899803.1 TetR family transcriptional regulator [Aeromonas media]MDX7921457.1 TetR family transcriptional regulator [Aeromonas media]TNI63454.1 TetR family transcriptional regulator [Aeromonas media]
MARRTKEEAQQTRCHIMSTALNLFCQQGLAKTNLTDIAKAADLTRGAIYWHFKNKEELFVTLWEELCAPLSHQLDACVDEQEPDPLGKLRSFLKEVMHKISTEPAHQQMFTIMFNLESLEGEAISLRDHMRVQSFNFFRDLEITLANAVRLGHLPADLDLHRAATLLHCTLDGYIINWLHFPERINLIREADFLLDTLFGLLANPSPSLLRRP